MVKSVHVDFIWDPDAHVWVATSDDVPGLVLESGSLRTLIARVRRAIPDLLAAQRQVPTQTESSSEKH